MMGLSGGFFLVWPSKSGGSDEITPSCCQAGGLEYAERASLSGSEPVVGSAGVAFVLALCTPCGAGLLSRAWRIRAY